MTSHCRVCGTDGDHERYVVREMMYGTRDAFEYFQCTACECLQIAKVPEDLGKYYPADYLSFQDHSVPKAGAVRRRLRKRRLRHELGEPDLVGSALARAFGGLDLPWWVEAAALKRDSRILDVGCGTGNLLLGLREMGFANLAGCDPFIPEDLAYPNGVRIRKCELGDMQGAFDLVMLHHSLEHMPEPRAVFGALHSTTAPRGWVLVRTPTVSSHAWRRYRENWVQLDAPRHLFVHSVQSIGILALRAGFTVESVVFDSTALQFLGSEQYLKDIPLRDQRSFKRSLRGSMFTHRDVARFEAMARELNARQEGDQAGFLLRRAD